MADNLKWRRHLRFWRTDLDQRMPLRRDRPWAATVDPVAALRSD